MKFSATPAAVAAVRAAIAAVRAAQAAVADCDAQSSRDVADYNAHMGRAAHRAANFDPRNEQHAEQYARDMAATAIWEARIRGATGRREAAQGRVTQALRALVSRLEYVTDYFEAPFCSEEALLPGGSGNAILTAEGVLSRRLPQHAPVLTTARALDSQWMQRTYALLLEGATPEPQPEPERVSA